MADPNEQRTVVVNLDLENFFPSISYARVKGIYKQLGYSEEVATLCASILPWWMWWILLFARRLAAAALCAMKRPHQ